MLWVSYLSLKESTVFMTTSHGRAGSVMKIFILFNNSERLIPPSDSSTRKYAQAFAFFFRTRERTIPLQADSSIRFSDIFFMKICFCIKTKCVYGKSSRVFLIPFTQLIDLILFTFTYRPFLWQTSGCASELNVLVSEEIH